jgi:hypothetical protein
VRTLPAPALALLLALGTVPAAAADRPMGRITVVDTAGEKHVLSDWAVSSRSRYDDFREMRGTSFAFKLYDKPREKEMGAKSKADGGLGDLYPPGVVMVPFHEIKGLAVQKAASEESHGRMTLTPVEGKPEVLFFDYFQVSGTEDLGDLGSGKFSSGGDKIKEIVFPPIPRDADAAKARPKGVPATVRDLLGREFEVDALFTYDERSNCSYAVHIPCTCGSTGQAGDKFFFKKGETALVLPGEKLSRLTIGKYLGNAFECQVKLATGAEHRLNLDVWYVVDMMGRSGDRYYGLPISTIRDVTFRPAAKPATPRPTRR